MALNATAQDFQDDLEMWGDHSAEVVIYNEDGYPATDFGLSPDEVRIMFTALRDYHAGL